MIKPDRPPYCDAWQIGVFWKYFLVAGLIFVSERVLREVRSRHRTYISKVIRASISLLSLSCLFVLPSQLNLFGLRSQNTLVE